MAWLDFNTKVKNALQVVLPQPDAYTCQSACCGMATGYKDVKAIRSDLQSIGNPGDPSVMGQWLRNKIGGRYEFDDNASLSEAREWLKQGCSLITHGWFTDSGHVIYIDGLRTDDATLSYKFRVQDPWSEFNFKAWAYNVPDVGYDGYYSSYGIYAACVASISPSHAASLYRKGELNSTRKGMWLHIIKP